MKNLKEYGTLEKLSDESARHLVEVAADFLDGFIVADADGRCIFASSRWEDITGFRFQDVKGMFVREFTPETKVDECIRTGRTISGVLVNVRSAAGGTTPLLCYYTPLYENGRVIGCATCCVVKGIDEVASLNERLNDTMEELQYYKKELESLQKEQYSMSNLVGESRQILDIKSQTYRAARSTSTVMIQGETGTGKELVAHSIFAMSSRSGKPYVKINCAAIPHDLLESELFGYVAGAFTGASKAGKRGKFLMADGGTLFLDEINQMPLDLQPKLLRALQEREIEPVGGLKPIKVDVRIIAAANKDLEKMVKQGLFREDLFYRLNVFNIDVPPLRERKSDIPLLCDAFLEQLNKQLGMSVPGIAEDAKTRLQEYNWPGNIRELRNVIERAMNLAWNVEITWDHFMPYFRRRQEMLGSAVLQSVPAESILTLEQAKEQAELKAVRAALRETHDNKTKAAELLGITRAMLHRKLLKYNI